jgi:hypothetical protein
MRGEGRDGSEPAVIRELALDSWSIWNGSKQRNVGSKFPSATINGRTIFCLLGIEIPGQSEPSKLPEDSEKVGLRLEIMVRRVARAWTS